MNIKIFDNEEALYKSVKQHILTKIKTANEFNLGLATGSSPERLYELIVKDYKRQLIDFSHVQTFNLDEYVGLDSNHFASYHFYMKSKLFEFVNFKKTNVPSGVGNLDENVNHYRKLLKTNQIDLQLLGVGVNGHIAFNEPGTPFDSLTHIIDLTNETIVSNSRFFEDEILVPGKAITMGLLEIMNAKEIILIALGDSKSEAIKLAVEGEVTVDVPVSILQKHPNVTLYLDEKAASKLTNKATI